jgi:hypothetical protein
MSLNVYTDEEIGAGVLAGLVLAIETAHAQGVINVDYCAGVLAMAKHQAIVHHVSWPAVIYQARAALGGDLGALFDAASSRVLEAGNGRFEALGREAGYGRALTLDEALTPFERGDYGPA